MISVVVVEDQTIVREGLLRLLEFSNEIQVVGSAADGQKALTLLDSVDPDVLLLDIQMPQTNGFEVVRVLKQQEKDQGKTIPQILLLTTFNDPEYVLQAQALGVNGFLLKDVSFENLVSSIKQAEAGEKIFPTCSAESKPTKAPVSTEVSIETLTPREQEIFSKLCEGLANKEIAKSLSLSEGTIKNHVSNILSKLGVRDRTQAVIKFG